MIERGERMMIPCTGGPTMCRAVTFPPPLEIDGPDGMWVLVDDAPEPWNWTYEWVQRAGSGALPVRDAPWWT